MKYISLDDLNNTIRKNLYKIPRDIDFIIGIPRSGMIVGSIISEFINVSLIDIESYCAGCSAVGGNRLSLLNRSVYNKVLVLDDTTYSGSSMKSAREKLSSIEGIEFIYGVAFLEGESGKNQIDFYLEDVIKYTQDSSIPIVLYEWNYMNHYPFISERCLYDIDGVLCVDPCDERNTQEYEKYIEDALPLFIPTSKIGGIVSYRLEKYKEVTIKWLEKYGVKYNNLILFPDSSWSGRERSGVGPGVFKGMIYKRSEGFILFIESDDRQAREIHEISGKPVLSVEKNILYE